MDGRTPVGAVLGDCLKNTVKLDFCSICLGLEGHRLDVRVVLAAYFPLEGHRLDVRWSSWGSVYRDRKSFPL